MSDLDTALAATPPATEAAVTVTSSDRKCGRHVYAPVWSIAGEHSAVIGHACQVCHKWQDPIRSRRGKSARRRGNDYERALAQRLGGTKVGHHGGPEDVRAGLFNVQAKVRAAFPSWMTDELAKLPRTGGRIPLLVVAKAGAPRVAIVVVTLDDWIALHGEAAS